MVIGAAVLLFIASFLDNYSIDGIPDSYDLPNLWGSGPVLFSVVLAGIIGAALVVVSRALPQPPKVVGLELRQFGVAFTVFAAWSALGNIFDPSGGYDNVGDSSRSPDAGAGLILALVATLLLAAAAVATPLVPALQAALVPAPRPQARSRTARSRPPVTATRAPRSRRRSAVSRRVSPASRVRSRSAADSRLRRSRPAGTSRRSGSPCRCRVRCTRRTARRRRSPSWPPAPGTWPSSRAPRASSPRRRTAGAAFCGTPPASSAAESRSAPRCDGPSPFRAGGRCRTVALLV